MYDGVYMADRTTFRTLTCLCSQTRPFRPCQDCRMGSLPTLLISILLVLVAAGCGGQDRVDSFPQHDERIPPDSGREFFAGKLVLKEGCLRAVGRALGGPDDQISLLVIWPRSFTLSTEDGPVRVVDAVGRIAARVGDHVRFGGFPSGPQTVRLRELEKELRMDCQGPYLWAGDEVVAISLDGPTTLTLQLPGSELHFPRQETILGGQESPNSQRIRWRAGLGRPVPSLESRSRTHQDLLHSMASGVHASLTTVAWSMSAMERVEIIAQVGDRLRMGGGYSSRG